MCEGTLVGTTAREATTLLPLLMLNFFDEGRARESGSCGGYLVIIAALVTTPPCSLLQGRLDRRELDARYLPLDQT